MNFEHWLLQTAIQNRLITIAQSKKLLEYRQQLAQQGKQIPVSIAILRLSLMDREQIQQLHEQFLREQEGLTLRDITSIPDEETSLPSVVEESPINPNQETIGRYQILRKIGKGSSGEVFLVSDPLLDRKVALKLLHGKNEIHTARFRRETRMIARLSHPNIIKIYDVGQEEDNLFFTMEYIPGRSLLDILARDGALEATRAVKIVKKLAEVLEYSHANNVLHRDIKPANIMIREDDEPILMDFGLAREMRGVELISKRNMIAGSPSYMSPEQACGENDELDERCDIFSLGVVFYEILTGRKAFGKKHFADALTQIVHESPVLPRTINPDIPKTLEDICLKAMQKERSQRYQSAQEMAEKLAHFLNPRKRQRTGMTQI